MSKKKPRKHKALSDEEMMQLSIKPRWWIEQQKPIPITGYKLPHGIEVRCEHEGVLYTGIIYPANEKQRSSTQ